MKLRSPQKAPAVDVVEAVARQTSDAENLAAIAGQERLANPYTNPAVRDHADRLRDEQHRVALDFEHTRRLRRDRVKDSQAAAAERELRALQAVRQTTSPARSVLALHRGRSRFMGASLAASLTLSAGSAMGVAQLATHFGSPAATGYIAEIGLTGLTTTVILYRSHLAEHGAHKLHGYKAFTLWMLMLAPLAASISANAFSAGAVGVFCSLGAAAFSLLSYVIADASAEVQQARVREVTAEDEDGLRFIASGGRSALPPVEHTPRAPAREPHVICSGPQGTLFLRRPLPKRKPAPTDLAGPEGARIFELEEVLGQQHAPVVYLIRNGERIKIGTTTSLRARVKRLCLRVNDIALVLHGSKPYEQKLHERFAGSRIGDSEWFDMSDELAAFLAAGGVGPVAPVGDNLAAAGDAIERPDESASVDNTSPAAVDSAAANVECEQSPTSRQRPSRRGANGRAKNTRRSMSEWVELTEELFHEEFRRLHRNPTGDEFAEAIKKAKLGTVSASTAKNIRTEILDRSPLPSLDSP